MPHVLLQRLADDAVQLLSLLLDLDRAHLQNCDTTGRHAATITYDASHTTPIKRQPQHACLSCEVINALQYAAALDANLCRHSSRHRIAHNSLEAHYNSPHCAPL
jgi:hypothetical protein